MDFSFFVRYIIPPFLYQSSLLNNIIPINKESQCIPYMTITILSHHS